VLVNTNTTKFERTKSKLKWIFYEQNKFDGPFSTARPVSSSGTSSSAHSDSSFPSTVSRKKNSGSWRITSRTHLDGLLEPRNKQASVSRPGRRARLGEIQSTRKAAARARFGKLEANRGRGGVIWELYRSRFASLARKSRDFRVEIRHGCARLGYEQRKETADTWAQGGSERRKRELEGWRAGERELGRARGAGALAVQAAYWPSLGRERGEKIDQGDSWAGWGLSLFFFFFCFLFSKTFSKSNFECN